MAELTPMKRQYYEIKQQYQDCLLFFRLGDFYEMFDDDARLASKLLDLALTTRDRSVENPDERTPMCGIPYHSAETYIARLIAKGYKVAICERRAQHLFPQSRTCPPARAYKSELFRGLRADTAGGEPEAYNRK